MSIQSQNRPVFGTFWDFFLDKIDQYLKSTKFYGRLISIYVIFRYMVSIFCSLIFCLFAPYDIIQCLLVASLLALNLSFPQQVFCLSDKKTSVNSKQIRLCFFGSLTIYNYKKLSKIPKRKFLFAIFTNSW